MQQNMRAAMDSWQNVTGSRIRFIPDNNNKERIIFHEATPTEIEKHTVGCNSPVGSVALPVDVTYPPNCQFGHELGHVIGLSHEHQRYDRDRYISIGFPVLQSCGLYFDSGVRCAYASTGSDFGPYRFDSVEQYGSTPDYPFYEKPSGVGAPGSSSPTKQDGSNVRQMYAYAYGWSKFFPLSRDVGADKTLDVHIVPGVPIMGSPAIASQGGPGLLDVYLLGANKHIYHRFYAGAGWSDYEDLGGDFDLDPAAGSFGKGTAIVASGKDGRVYTKVFRNGAWSGWDASAGVPGAGACSISLTTAGNTASIVARTCNSEIYSWSYGLPTAPPWSMLEPAPQGTTWIGRPAIAASSVSHMDLLINSSNGHLWHKWYEAGWKPGWEDLACCVADPSSPAAVASAPGRLDIVFKGRDGDLWWKYYESGQWKGPFALGGSMIADPAAVSGVAGHMDVVAILGDGGLWQRWFH